MHNATKVLAFLGEDDEGSEQMCDILAWVLPDVERWLNQRE